MEQRLGPYPSPAARRQWAANDASPMTALVSGEITANVTGAPLGAANVGGRVSNVWLSVGKSGKDDVDTLSLTVDVKINGTSCLSTAPVIAHVSGEASINKTTKVSGAGITQAVMNSSNNDVSPGDMLTYDLTLNRTTPTSEMQNMAVVVEFEPT